MKKSLSKLDGYSQKQIDFFVAMIESGGNIAESSKKASVSEATAHRWLNNGISKDIKQIKSNLVERYLSKLQVSSGSAVDVLLSILNDSKNSSSVRLKACKIVLDMTLKVNESDEILEKLEVLEERLSLYER